MTIPLNTIIHGDGLEVLKGIPADSFDSCVTDPPYGLGFMGKAWDKSGIANNVDLWREVLRVLKPGAHLLSFGGSRTYHRMACAIEDAGFEIRDQIMWIYGSGFPKSHDIGKAIDKQAGAVREVVGNTIYANGKAHAPSGIHYSEKKPELQSGADRVITAPATPEARKWDGWGTALKPAHEPICVARKPFKGTVAENVLQHGTGAINVDGCRIETQQSRPLIISKNGDSKACFGQGLNNSWQDPAGTILGRFPANVIHDGSDEVTALFPETQSRSSNTPQPIMTSKGIKGGAFGNDAARKPEGHPTHPEYLRGGFDDSGSAARFFYCAKASRDERGPGNNHPTVKPLALIQYLVKLVTPPGGIVLDPFCGSGTLGIAAGKLGMKWQGIELNPKYIEIAERRIEREVGLLLDMEAAHAD